MSFRQLNAKIQLSTTRLTGDFFDLSQLSMTFKLLIINSCGQPSFFPLWRPDLFLHKILTLRSLRASTDEKIRLSTTIYSVRQLNVIGNQKTSSVSQKGNCLVVDNLEFSHLVFYNSSQTILVDLFQQWIAFSC